MDKPIWDPVTKRMDFTNVDLGRKVRDDVKKKISKTLTGRKASQEQRQKLSESRKKLYAEGKIDISKFIKAGQQTDHKKYSPKGERASNWKGGRNKDNCGYVWVTLTEPDPILGDVRYIAEHRLVMSHVLGRPLNGRLELVHHKDGNKENNDPDNLLLITSAKAHHGLLICPYCGKEFGLK